MRRRHILLVPGSLAFTPAALSAGGSVLDLPGAAGLGAEPLRIHVHRPAGWTPQGRVIAVMHGVQRDAGRYLAEWAPLAERAGILVFVPEFSRRNFPTTASYNWGNVVDSDDRALPPSAWIFEVLDRAWAELRARTGATREGYALFGHSAGAQFAHRYLLLAAATRAEAIITANAGSYTMPRRDVAFPFGLGGIELPDDALARAFARPVTVLLGSDDVDPAHPSLPRQPGAMAQGPHRLARGLRFFAEAREAATRLGVPFRWRLETVPGVGHDNAGMAVRAIAIAAGS